MANATDIGSDCLDIKWYHGADLTVVNNGEPGRESACLRDAKQNGLRDREIESVRKASLLLFHCPVGINLMHLHAAKASLCFPYFFYVLLIP